MANNDYIFLHDINGNPIKPVTDLAAINMTTTNGIHVEQLNGGTIGIQTGYIESAYYTEMVDPAVGPARPGESYIEGGTMYTLLGGYTVSQNVPGPNPSPYMVPSEAAVREAIDAYVATGGTDIVPGYGITVSGGSISVKAGAHIVVDSTGVSVPTATDESQGVVELRNTVYSMEGGDAVVPTINAVANALAQKQDNLTFDTTTGIDTVGGTTVTNNIGTVEEVLTGATGADIATAENLRGALSVGQAVDVSSPIVTTAWYANFPDENIEGEEPVWYQVGSSGYNARYLKDQILKCDFTIPAGSTTKTVQLGFDYNNFPKAAPGLEYIFMCEIRNISGFSLNQILLKLYGHSASEDISTNQPYWANRNAPVESGSAFTRLVGLFGDGGTVGVRVVSAISGTVKLEVKNMRQYEVTALTEEARAYIAQLPDPDAFFRSTSAYSIRDKYLVKQDMVCPFIPTINMPDNSDLTVAAGLSYKIKYTNNNTHTITADTIPADGYGWDTHIQMFIKGTSAINFQKPLILMDALTPNAGHNLSVKWRNGDALVYVDDTNAGYIVTLASGTGNGTLNFGIVDPDTDYVIFAAGLDGTTVDAGTAVFGSTATTITTLNVLGNGTDATTITGNIGAASGKTINLQSLTIDSSTLDGGTIFLDDVVLGGNISITGGIARCANTVIPFGSTIYINNWSTNNATYTRLDDVLIEGTIIGAPIITTSGFNIRGSAEHIGIIDDNLSGVHPKRNLDILVSGDFSNLLITGFTVGFGVIYTHGTGEKINHLNNVTITGNTVTQQGAFCTNRSVVNYITGCTINNNVGYCDFYFIGDTTNYIKDSVIGTVRLAGSHCKVYYEGNIIVQTTNTGSMNSDHGGTYQKIMDNTTVTFRNENDYACYIFCDEVGDNVTFINVEGNTSYIDGCMLRSVYQNHASGLFSLNGDSYTTRLQPIVITSKLPIWRATNFVIYSRLDASQADTIRLSGTTFTSLDSISPYVKNANRIQLPAGSTNSFSGNSAAANTKILSAGIIVVGDDPASPSGSATIVNAAGVSSTVSGIGTYIDKEGDNDFVAISNVKSVTQPTGTGANTLTSAFANGDADTNKWVKLNNNLTASATYTANTNIVNKMVVTNEYEPIFGGTFTVSSGGTMIIDEATKTTTVTGGANVLGIVDIRGGKDSVIDLGYDAETQTGGTYIRLSSTMIITGVTITGGSTTYGGCVGGAYSNKNNLIASNVSITSGYAVTGGGGFYLPNGSASFVSCSFLNNSAGYTGGALNLADRAAVDATACVFTGNKCGSGGAVFVKESATLDMTSCYISGNTGGTNGIFARHNASVILTDCAVHDKIHTADTPRFELKGSNYIASITGGTATVTLTSGAILDLTGNTNATPINPGGDIKVNYGGCTVINSAGASVSVVPGMYAIINNQGVAATGATGGTAYCVTSASGTGGSGTEGSLYYGLTTATEPYIFFDPALDGNPIYLAATGATVSRRANVYGNGINNTILDFSLFDNNIVPVVTRTSSTVGICKLYDCTLTGRMATGTENTGTIMGTSNTPFELKNVLVTGNTGSNQIFYVGSNPVVVNITGCTFSKNNTSRVVYFTGSTTTIDRCLFTENNASYCDLLCWTNAFTMKDCIFNNNASPYAIRLGGGARLSISGSTFGVTARLYQNSENTEFTFSGTNVINSTVSGAGTVAFTDGATVTSTIPSGSTIGTGVISTASIQHNINNSTVTFSGITISGSTCEGAFLYPNKGAAFTMTNCIIERNTINTPSDYNLGQPYAIYGVTDTTKVILNNVVVRNNVGTSQTANNVYIMSAKGYITNLTCASLLSHTGVLVIDGTDNHFMLLWSTNANTARVIFTPGCVVFMPQAYSTRSGAGMMYVGTYDEATDTITTTGTATVVLEGTTVSISGSGTTIDKTSGLHS